MSTFRVNTNVLSMGTLRNLSETNARFGQSVTRLSTGLRINSGADDPAGLQISEGFRAQIGALDQALRNNSDATNFAKTAEGALNEVSRLLRDARALAVANGNDATLSPDQKQANQNQLNSILESVDRISNQTTYGTKRLLDGSVGVKASVTHSKVASLSLGGTLGTSAITSSGNITVGTGGLSTLPAQASLTGSRTVSAASMAAALAAAVGSTGNVTINGVSVVVTAGMTNAQLRDAINAKSNEMGVTAEVVDAGSGNFNFKLVSNKFGTIGNSVSVSDTGGLVNSSAGTATLSGGVNAGGAGGINIAIGSITSNFTVRGGDDGLTLTDAAGNRLSLVGSVGTIAANTVVGYAYAGAAQFQIGANAGQTTQLAIASTSTATLGLTGLDITSGNGANLAMAAIETAIASISQTRGTIGNFMRNVLESNNRSLSVAKENLTASESAIRDVDVAEEMSSYTKWQILQQSGLAVLAQANQAPQAVLSLLRG